MASSKSSVLITGANGGLGSATVAHILKTSAVADTYTGIYAVRKAATATNLKAKLNDAPKTHKYHLVDVDLGSIASVKKAAAGINAQVADGTLPPIQVLILNAAYQDSTELVMTHDGYEMSWQVNYLSNLILVLMLLESMDKENGRIMIISSWSHNIEDPQNATGGSTAYTDPRYTTLFPSPEALAEGKWSTPQEDPTWYAGYRRYGASKLCAAMLMFELGDRIARDPKLSNIAVIGLDPGAMPSDLIRRGGFIMRVVMVGIVMPIIAPIMTYFNPNGSFRTTTKSAADVVHACFEIESPRGKTYYLNGSAEAKSSKETKDLEKRRELWQYGIRAAEIKGGDSVLAEWQ